MNKMLVLFLYVIGFCLFSSLFSNFSLMNMNWQNIKKDIGGKNGRI
jgi:hypothetical protein